VRDEFECFRMNEMKQLVLPPRSSEVRPELDLSASVTLIAASVPMLFTSYCENEMKQKSITGECFKSRI
jgi:hypothetical protein